MGYTPAGGIPMGTRSGDLDPGVMLELARRYDDAALSDLVYHHMGLLALSDGRKQRHGDAAGEPQRSGPFCGGLFLSPGAGRHRRICRQGGGIDALVFSGGIGENAPQDTRVHLRAAWVSWVLHLMPTPTSTTGT